MVEPLWSRFTRWLGQVLCKHDWISPVKKTIFCSKCGTVRKGRVVIKVVSNYD
jgi:hypothetical protein